MSKQTFEQSMTELDRIVERMEQPELPLEESLKLYEEGVRLTRLCQKMLSDAEKKIEQLMQDSDDGDE